MGHVAAHNFCAHPILNMIIVVISRRHRNGLFFFVLFVSCCEPCIDFEADSSMFMLLNQRLVLRHPPKGRTGTVGEAIAAKGARRRVAWG